MKNAGMGVSASEMREGFERHSIDTGDDKAAKAKRRLDTMLGPNTTFEGDPSSVNDIPESGRKIKY